MIIKNKKNKIFKIIFKTNEEINVLSDNSHNAIARAISELKLRYSANSEFEWTYMEIICENVFI